MKINKLLILSAVLFLTPYIYAQFDCAPGQKQVIITCYSDQSCTTTIGEGFHVIFVTYTPIYDEYSGYTDANGQITHCFDEPGQQWWMRPDIDCMNPCYNYMYPNNSDYSWMHYWCYQYPADCDCSKDTDMKSQLLQNYPNPFNPVTNIKFILPKDSYAKLTIYDVSGKTVEILADGYFTAGVKSFDFDGSKYSSGVYIYKLETPDYNKIMKMVLIK
jgi:hypothetical protein